MISRAEAVALLREHLDDTPRAAHSRLVAHIMREAAHHFRADSALWEVVGLCHDLDFFETATDPAAHGLLAAERLRGKLPEEALAAIRAHDHRTGVRSESLLADMLKLADVLAVLDDVLGRERLCSIGDGEDLTERELGVRAYLAEMLSHYAAKHALTYRQLAEMRARASD
jgi:hypothetical protein